jgi:uncharacterized protein (TIGR03435 family)
MSLFRAVLVCFFVAVPASAESQTFEKGTIKPVRSADPRSTRLPVLPYGELIAHAVLVIELISYAYDVPSNPSPRLRSLPDWIYGDRHDIEAKASPNAITTTSRDGETQLRVKQMIRRVLVDRFGLVMRVDRQRMATYAMTASRNCDRSFDRQRRSLPQGTRVRGLVGTTSEPAFDRWQGEAVWNQQAR